MREKATLPKAHFTQSPCLMQAQARQLLKIHELEPLAELILRRAFQLPDFVTWARNDPINLCWGLI
jgi:hypothetical protein